MADYNVEIKARCTNPDEIRQILSMANADFRGKDRQIDSYFNVQNGRLKIREGAIENGLIQYHREDVDEPKQSNYMVYKSSNNKLLKELLTKALGLLTVVDKEREIYYIDNVKFHIDTVKGLGDFIEIEANGTHNDDDDNDESKDTIRNQCKYYLKMLRISNQDLIPFSYSDMMLKQVKAIA